MMTSYFKIFTKNLHAVTLITRAHKFVGFGTIIAGLFNCVKGWQLYSGSGLAIFIIGLIAICVLFIGFEIRQVCFKNRKKAAPERNKSL